MLTMITGRRVLPGLLLLAGFTAALFLGCDRAPDTLLLPGTGERVTPAVASISGTVVVPGSGTPLPAVRVFALRDVDTTCVSVYRQIQLLGNYTNPEFSVGGTPQMVRLAGCVWVDSLYLNPDEFARTPGRLQFKFVTNGSFDNPPDYGSPGSQVDGLEGAVVSGANGDDGNILADVSDAGSYFAQLDETRLRYSVLPWDGAPLADINRQTGAFTIDQLRDGTYTLVFQGRGLVTRRLTKVVIKGGAPVDVGTVTVRSATVAITGRVAFEDTPTPAPTATVTLFATDLSVVGEVTTSDAFSFSGIESGTYTLRFRADGYRDSTQAVQYATQAVDVGTIVMKRGCSSRFSRIQVAGNLNPALYGNFELSKSPDMTKIGGCRWQATLNGITAGDHFFKFVTDGAFDNPLDYGSDEVCRPSLTGSVTPVSGQGTAICVTFPETGNYKFTLDEETKTYTIERIVIQQPGTIRGTVSFAGTPAPGLKAFVQLFEGGTANQVASDSTTGAYEFTDLAAGNYDLRFSAAGYEATTRQATVTAGQITEVGNTQLQPGFTSQFTKIQVIGNFPGIDWDPVKAPYMTQSPVGVWKGTVAGITGGSYYFKFRTNDNWETPDGDYGSPTDETCRAELSGAVKLLTAYPAAALCVIFPAGTAAYDFTLNERDLTYTIVRQGQAGTGSITGTVTFAGVTTPPLPPATVRLQTQAGTSDIGSTTINTTTGAFSFTQLDAGSYKILVSAGCFQEQNKQNITVGSGATDVGTIAMPAGTSRFTTMQLVGTFNGFSEAAPPMTQVATCVWADTVALAAGDIVNPVEFKFRTNNNWDDEPDYGSPGDQTDPLPAGPVMQGAGGPSGNVKVQILEAGSYRFELNEKYLTYTITRIEAAAPRGWRFYR